jgi:hypothetical protein
VLAASGCLTLAACGGSGASDHHSQSPTARASASASAEPTSGPAAVAAITANWKTVFNGKAPIPRRLALVQDGPQVATVHYEVLLLGTPLLKNQVGTAVYLDGIWKVAIASFCGLAYLEYPKGSPKLPAACRS